MNAKERTQRERKSERKFLQIREREVENRNRIKTKKERKKEREIKKGEKVDFSTLAHNDSPAFVTNIKGIE